MTNTELKTYRLMIKGKVQGVGFRHWFSNLAISLGLNGYIQNKESKDEVEGMDNIEDIRFLPSDADDDLELLQHQDEKNQMEEEVEHTDDAQELSTYKLNRKLI